MSTNQIIEGLPKLTHEQRREIARRLFELEEEAHTMADCDRRANANFLLLDAMENHDARDHKIEFFGSRLHH